MSLMFEVNSENCLLNEFSITCQNTVTFTPQHRFRPPAMRATRCSATGVSLPATRVVLPSFIKKFLVFLSCEVGRLICNAVIDGQPQDDAASKNRIRSNQSIASNHRQ